MKLADVVGGVRVRIVGPGDKFFPRSFKGRIGRVRAFDPNTCGSSEADPMLMVAVLGVGTEGFFLEELEEVREEGKEQVIVGGGRFP